MKIVILFISILCISNVIKAQQKETLLIKNGVLTLQKINTTQETNSILKNSLFNDKYFVIIKLENDVQRKIVESYGISLLQKLAIGFYYATIPKDVDFENFTNFFVAENNPSLKCKEADFVETDKSKNKIIAVSFFGVNKYIVQSELRKLGITIVENNFETETQIFVQYNPNQVKIIASLPFTNNISVLNTEINLLNDESRAAHSISAVAAESGRNLTGRNVTVGHGDLGLPRDHIDIESKSIDRYTGGGNFHGNHTSGTVSGAGIINEKYKGIAFTSPTINALFTDIIINTPSYITDYNMVATNNSYFSGLGGCPGNGAYNALSVYTDAQTFNLPNNLHVFAAGNDGTIACNPYPTSFGTVKSGFQTSKNVLTVGSINTDLYLNAPLSSRGPTLDGRIKPEIVAKGANATSTVPFNIYDFTTGGTSMAAPVVTGSVALLQERHKQLFSGNTANSDLVKALLCNSAEDLGNVGPDFTYGFGMLNIRKSIESLEQNQFFNGTIPSTGNQNTHNITIPANTRRLKVMLYWIDKEGTAAALNSLVNDLDITLTDPSAVVHFPFVLNSIPGNVNNTATQGVDRINNIEQCIIENPTTGNYVITVRGFNLPIVNQKYVVVYCFEHNGVTVEYPFGNEKLVPTELEKIRWTAFGNESNNFTVEYSNNNGGSWTVLDNNVPNTARSLNWTVPADVTNDALIRVTRNGTAFTDVSDFNFTILNTPTVTLTNICDGYVQMNWNAITDATAYEVMIKDADSMKRIATTTATNHLVNGLQTNTTYWLTVRPVNGAKTGRRAIAKSIIPSTGDCSLPALDNDIKLVSINTPNTGRYLTQNASNALTAINVTIKNIDDVVSTIPIDFSYSINGGAIVTQTATPSIVAGGFFNFTFPTHSPSLLPANYNIKVWIDKAGDTQKTNDTLTKMVRLLPNPNIDLTTPFVDDFETTAPSTYLTKTVGFIGNDKMDFNTNVNFGRARTFVNTGFARSGINAVTLDQLHASGFALDTLFGTYNISAYDTILHQIRAEVYVKDQGQDVGANNKIWVRGNDANNWIQAYDLGADQSNLGVYKLVTLNINELFNSATPRQNFSSSFQMAFGQEGDNAATIVNPFNTNEDGYTFDDVKIINAINDIGIKQIISPIPNPCNLSSATPISFSVKNHSNVLQNNIQVSYRINNGATITETISSLAANQTVNYTFATTANLSAYIDYTVDFWVSVTGDNYTGNDSVLRYEFRNSPLVNSFPYLERFEADNGNWYVKGSNTSWEWGTPAKAIINKAPSGTRAWVTSLSANHNDNETSYLVSPCFDLSGVTNPTLSFSKILRIEDDCPCDYAWMEYSTNAGLSWQKLGAVGQGTNWYDNTATQAWQMSKTHWHVSTIPIPTNSATTKFRFVMQADGGVNYEGIGLDDIHIYSSAPIYTGATINTGLTQNISGNLWQHFSSGGNRIASLLPNNNNLGSTEAKVFLHTGSVRNSNGQYYVNRNIVVQPTNAPSSPVKLRFYFTDTEVEDVLNATGCGTCTKPNNAYEFGVTKYSGSVAEENGDLADNTLLHEFLLPGQVDIIPYENGYYAEFDVNSFSEFWLNNGGTGLNQPLPVSLIQFTAKKQLNTVILQWNTTNEIAQWKYEIERSSNGIQFTKIGTINALNNTSNTYNFVDAAITDVSGTYFYRLKIIDQNNLFKYSSVRLVNWNNTTLQINVTPNPVINGYVQIVSNQVFNQLQIFNSNGKLVVNEKTNTATKTLNVSNLTNGVYSLKVITLNGNKIIKFVVE